MNSVVGICFGSLIFECKCEFVILNPAQWAPVKEFVILSLN